MKNSRSILVLVGLFAVLALLVISQNSVQAPPPPPIPPTATPTLEEGDLLRAFPDLTVLDIQAIRLEALASGAQLTLSRDPQGRWTAPDLEGELDDEAATNIARTLVLLPYGRSINILDDTDLDDFGFENSADLLFHIIRTNGDTHSIAIGALSESEASYYALIDERDEIFQIERGPVDFLRNFIDSPPIRLTN